MPRTPPPTAAPAPTAPPVRLTERLLRVGLTIKDDLKKAQESWKLNFHDPIKDALERGPQAPLPEVTECILGGVRISLSKEMPKDEFNIPLLTAHLERMTGTQVTLADVKLWLQSGVLVVAKPVDVAAVISARAGVAATSFVTRPLNPDVPINVSLRWNVLPNQDPIVGPLQDLPDRVALAAAGASPDRMVVAPPVSSRMAGTALEQAEAIDRANAGRLGIAPAPAAARTPTRADVERQVVTEIEDPAAPRPRRRGVSRRPRAR